ncbi:MAG TPA: FtsX-like permease family protein [Puia sp.]|nr:FtsX-like permease family protein [Puia sp.]
MLKNYFRTGFRNLANNKLHSFINITGLAVGMTVTLLIGLWVWDELSFNTWHRNYDRIAGILLNETIHGEVKTSGYVPYPLVNTLETNYRDHFDQLVAAMPKEQMIFSANEKNLSVTGQFMQADGPKLFTLHMLRGNLDGLATPNSILLSASAAKAFFGNEDPMGQTLQINDTSRLQITGVYADLPANTTLCDIKFLGSWDWYLDHNVFIKNKGWDNHAVLLYAAIPAGNTFARVSLAIENAQAAAIKNMANMGKEAATKPRLWLHPMSRWHLYGTFKDGVASLDAIHFVQLVAAIGGMVLFLACINFMNLSTARSAQRAKEVGIRKTIGSGRRQLIAQFIGESYLVTLLAFSGALLLTALALPWFNDLSAKRIQFPWTAPGFWLSALTFVAVTGLLAGSYPAFYLSSFKPVNVLKGEFRTGRPAILSRQMLVVTQFTFSIALIICTMVVAAQIRYAKNRPVGYSRDGLILVKMHYPEYVDKYAVLTNELTRSGAVTGMAAAQSPLTGVWSHSEGFQWADKNPAIHEDFATLNVSAEYGKTVGWQFLDGRDFRPGFTTDSAGFVINESAARFMGLPHPVGSTISWTSRWRGDTAKSYTILGVVKDMVMESPYDPVKPTVFFLGGSYNWITLRLAPNAAAGASLEKIAAVFKRVAPNIPFEYSFADWDYAQKFAAEERIGKLAGLFAALAVFISCLGLFGMSAFMAEQRTREIGIRKVLGASLSGVLSLLSRDFLKLVGLSLLIGMPFSWYGMNRWLSHYTYHTPLSLWIFVAAGAGTLAITLLTISYQSIQAALRNPVQSLRR